MSTGHEHTSSGLATIPELLHELASGRAVIIVDDEDRENEGDLVFAAEHATEALVAFTIRYSGGVVCLAVPDDIADTLDLPPMVRDNRAPLQTAFTVSIEARYGVSTGISAADRATTLRVAAAAGATAADLTRPGHIFPLRARQHGVLARNGHTEASVDLCRLAGLRPAGVISELMHDDGRVMRLPAILEFAAHHGLKVGSIAELARHRLATEILVTQVASTRLPTEHGDFELHGFRDDVSGAEHVALTQGEFDDGAPVLARLHSECLTGDALGSLRCDCGAQRSEALRRIAAKQRGAMVYLRQEGRGIGLLNKIRAYALQDAGADTVDANRRLGFADDARDYAMGAQILRALGIGSVRLMTNNPAKIEGLQRYGMNVAERLPLQVGQGRHNAHYLSTKHQRLGHLCIQPTAADIRG